MGKESFDLTEMDYLSEFMYKRLMELNTDIAVDFAGHLKEQLLKRIALQSGVLDFLRTKSTVKVSVKTSTAFKIRLLKSSRLTDDNKDDHLEGKPNSKKTSIPDENQK